MITPIRTVHTPASFGAEWTDEESLTRYQLCNPRGTTTLLFGFKPEKNTSWGTTPVFEPERFMNRAPRTENEFLTVVRAFVAEEG